MSSFINKLGFFYITGDVEIEDGIHITDFNVGQLYFKSYDNNSYVMPDKTFILPRI
jgi:hypothetical protein